MDLEAGISDIENVERSRKSLDGTQKEKIAGPDEQSMVLERIKCTKSVCVVCSKDLHI
jgi:hypothetical protein